MVDVNGLHALVFQEVKEDDTICLVEVMKNFHPVNAGVAGKVVEFLVEAEDEVGAGETVAVIEST